MKVLPKKKSDEVSFISGPIKQKYYNKTNYLYWV